MSDTLTMEKVIELVKEAVAEKKESMRKLFSHYGFDYDRGDLLVINREHINLFSFIPNDEQVKVSNYIPINVAAFFLRNESAVLLGAQKFNIQQPLRASADAFGLRHIGNVS